MKLESKIAIVTGASRGIGRAIAERLAAEGALVAVHYGRSEAAAREVVAGIAERGGSAFALGADVGEMAQLRALFEALDAELQSRTGQAKFDILVNNAGIFARKPFEQISEADFDAHFAVNVKAPFFAVQMALSRLNDGGRIINLGTGLTRYSRPPAPLYAATKGAVDTLTKQWAQLLGERAITVNTLAPGVIDTDMNADRLGTDEGRRAVVALSALGRIGEVEDVAQVAAFLASDESRWVTGQRLEASGGAQL